jgi:PKD repeat protein
MAGSPNVIRLATAGARTTAIVPSRFAFPSHSPISFAARPLHAHRTTGGSMNSGNRLRGLFSRFIFAALVFASSSRATTIVMPTDDQLIEKTPVIAIGTVTRTETVERNGAIRTESHIAVERFLKGSGADELTISELGGRIGDRFNVIFGAPEYVSGERVLVFIAPWSDGLYRTRDLFVGKFAERRAADGTRLWFRPQNPDATLLDHNLRPLSLNNTQRTADAFEQFIRDRVANRTAASTYAIENPLLTKSTTTRPPLQANFTLISEPNQPTVYRWKSFDSGTAAKWYSVGAQSGFSGGGVTELQGGMSAWTSYSAAKILYTYNGTVNAPTPGLTHANGYNEVVFNDLTNEVDGTFNSRTGGVVGVGGFNNTGYGGNWNAPFDADAAHHAGTFETWTITEANLVIQDGVTPSAGISSAELAEIIAHEFGHTLGFGHSADSSALMYYSVSGRGASLRSDDQTAARWLYPNGSSQPPQATKPAAPSNLVATLTGSSTARLDWSDNASDETAQSVYMSSGGPFALVGDVAANATGANLNSLAAGTTYSFYVTAKNSAGESTGSNTARVTTPSSTPAVAANFSFTPLAPKAGDVVTFSDLSSGSPTSWSWNFGDGASSTSKNPTHQYSNGGTYTVTLTARNSASTNSATRAIVVTAGAPATPSVVSDFAFSPATPRVGEAVSFNDASTGSPTAWSWNFGDGSTSTAKNASHAFSAAGSYSVSLAVSNAGSSNVKIRTVVVTALPRSFESVVAVTAQTSGVGSTYWRTELSIFNASAFASDLELVYIPGAGGTSQSRRTVLSPNATMTWSNTLRDLFNLSSGAGALIIRGSSISGTPNLKIASRTFTDTSAGTYGQFVPDVPGDDSTATTYLTALAANGDYRTNIGLVNRSSASVTATLTLIDAAGNVAGQKSITVPANNFQQSALTALFSNASGSNYTLRVAASAPRALLAYASVIDNRSQDPIYMGAAATSSERSIIIPAVARTDGANGTYWRSDLSVYNAASGTLTLTARFWRAGIDNRNASTKNFSIAAGRVLALNDVLSALGAGTGSGALELAWSGPSTGPIITSRTYTTRAGDAASYGQSIDAAYSRSFSNRSIVTGLKSDGSFRTNIGLVNRGDTAAQVTLTLYSSFGNVLATAFTTVPPKSQLQNSVASFFPKVSAGSLGNVTIEARADVATILLYGSVVDNVSGDPIFAAGE